MIVLDACEAFFLRGGDDLAVDDEAGSGVVIERGDAENVYHGSEESVDERRDSRALGEHEQHADRDERDDDGGEPELLVLPHELPQLIDGVKLRHKTNLATKRHKMHKMIFCAFCDQYIFSKWCGLRLG